jgi:hypothetical protein
MIWIRKPKGGKDGSPYWELRNKNGVQSWGLHETSNLKNLEVGNAPAREIMFVALTFPGTFS